MQSTVILCAECYSEIKDIDGEKDENTSLYNLYIPPCQNCADKKKKHSISARLKMLLLSAIPHEEIY